MVATPPRPPPCAGSSIVVLGQSLLRGGGVPATLRARVDTAAALHDELGLPLILSGGDVSESGTTEAAAMRGLLAGRVPARALLLDEAARNTIENARNALAIARGGAARPGAGGGLDLHLVTSEFHLPRARYIVDAVLAAEGAAGVRVVGHAAAGGSAPGPPRAHQPSEINDWRLSERIEHERRLLQDVMERWLQRCGVAPPPRERLDAALSELARVEAAGAR